LLTLEGGLIAVQILEHVRRLVQNVLHGFHRRPANKHLDNISAEAPVVAKESMSFGECVNVLVEEEQSWIFRVFWK
jgi:hypothetical protein